jgi:outer membrane protein assembly factor BamE (lipoprotein component of BamABCDE complex)
MKFFTFPLLFFAIFACSFRVEKSGYMFDNNDIDFIKKGVTSKTTLLKSLGTPTIVSQIDDKELWIYYSENTKHILFFKPTIIDRDILLLKFDEESRVDDIKKLDLKDEDRQYFFNQNKTFVQGHKNNLFKSIYENIGSIIPR